MVSRNKRSPVKSLKNIRIGRSRRQRSPAKPHLVGASSVLSSIRRKISKCLSKFTRTVTLSSHKGCRKLNKTRIHRKEEGEENALNSNSNSTPNSNSNWELQQGQFWKWMKAFEEENNRRRHWHKWRPSHIFPKFPKIHFLSFTTPLGLLHVHTH